MNSFNHLLSPLTISAAEGSLTLRNRVLVSAHVPGFAENNMPGKHYIDYHRRYAAGGVGMQITGGTPVHESGLLSSASDGLWNLDDRVIPGYAQLAAAVHQEGGRILAQLAHSGGTVLIDQPGRASWSASAIRSDATGRVPHQMTLSDIAEVTDAFAAAAARVRQAGLDGIELLAAFGFLPQAFLSPLSNIREDQYGGSLPNRMRFIVKVLSAIRQQLGPDQILGVRLPGDEFEPGGLDLAAMTEICQELCRQKLVDYLNIIAHTNFSLTGRAKHWAPTPAPHGVFVNLASRIRQAVDVPVFAVGRIIDPRHAEQIIASGAADMVGMTRAHICDPNIVQKILSEQSARIRPCVGANTCIANRYAGKSIRCMHNPKLKSPGYRQSDVHAAKKVVVVGAGPAGLEAARLCAMRGHQVSLYEASDHVGGQLALWASVPSTQELNKIISWREAELKHLGVTIRLNQRVSATQLAQLDAEEIIVATGAVTSKRSFTGMDPEQVLTPTTLLQLNETNFSRALVCSDGRGQAGLVAAEWLVNHGVQVEIITADIAVAADLDPTNRTAWYERLGKSGVTMTAQVAIEQVHFGDCTLTNQYSGTQRLLHDIDLIVDWSGCLPEDQLLSDAESSQTDAQWHAIGDCLAPRNVEVAMAEALDIAEMI